MNLSIAVVGVATYLSAGGQGKIKRASSKKGKCTGVATNLYLRKTLEKAKRVCKFQRKGFGSCLHAGKVLAPHASATRNDIL